MGWMVYACFPLESDTVPFAVFGIECIEATIIRNPDTGNCGFVDDLFTFLPHPRRGALPPDNAKAPSLMRWQTRRFDVPIQDRLAVTTTGHRWKLLMST